MSNSTCAPLKPLAAGVILALLAILVGFSLGAMFGIAEDSIKARLAASGESVLESVYHGDVAKRDAVVSKSWTYMKRAHLHGGAIGTAALSSILLLGFLGEIGRVQKISAVSFGAGALIYSLFWMFAAFKAPALGGTHEAKESLRFLAVPGAGMCILGLVGTLFSAVKRLCA